MHMDGAEKERLQLCAELLLLGSCERMWAQK